MKLTLEQITDGQDEVIVRYRQRTEEIEGIIRSLQQRRDRICAELEDGTVLIAPADVLYLESVEGGVYVYTAGAVARTGLTLASAESRYSPDGFFRCSKSMVINIYHVSYLKSISGGRVDVTMDNGEHIIISRRYVRALRAVLKGE